ncbi:MAG: carbon-nitrogen hydrolase family protein, partial [Candidatus Choladocola sp.]|nr:carbon-nitrogen hydrolase family protein [Candidatus Choladocola sp.]
MKLKSAVLQKRSLDRQYEKSAGIIIEKMEEAAENKADILLLPEVFLTGYELPMTNEEAVSEDCPYIRQVCDAAKRLHLGVVLTAMTKGIEKPQNSAFVISKDGA